MRRFTFVLLLVTSLTSLAGLAGQSTAQEVAAKPSAGVVEGGEEVLDQSFVKPLNGVANINEGAAFVAQSYRAGATGWLSGVNIDVHSKRGLNPDVKFDRYHLHVALYEIKDDYPAAILGEVTLPTDEVPLSMLIKFPQNIRQIKGVQYAIAVNYENAPPAGADQWLGNWAGATGNIDGQQFYGGDGKNWNASRSNDFVLRFQTFVIAAPQKAETKPCHD